MCMFVVSNEYNTLFKKIYMKCGHSQYLKQIKSFKCFPVKLFGTKLILKKY